MGGGGVIYSFSFIGPTRILQGGVFVLPIGFIYEFAQWRRTRTHSLPRCARAQAARDPRAC